MSVLGGSVLGTFPYVLSRVPYVVMDSDGSESFQFATIQAFVDLFSLTARIIRPTVSERSLNWILHSIGERTYGTMWDTII